MTKEKNTTNITFGKAIAALAKGKRVARQGWNGKNMFLFSYKALDYSITSLLNNPNISKDVAEFFKQLGQPYIKCTAYLCMYAADGSIVSGWLASQTDILADDWCILD